MLPDINIFGKTITWYAIAVLIGTLTTFAFQQIYTKKKGHDEVFMLYILLFACIGVFIGGHTLYAITMYKQFIFFINNINNFKNGKEVLEHLISIVGGSVFYGGLLGGIFTSYLYIRKKKNVNLDPYIGIGTLCIPLFHIFGRIGCFLSGCCYGIESDWGFYLNYSPVPQCIGIRRLPIQLIESGCNLVLFIVLFLLFDKKKLTGKQTLIGYLLSYSVVRFVLEYFRGDEYRGFIGPFSTSQFISLIIITICMLFSISKVVSSKTSHI